MKYIEQRIQDLETRIELLEQVTSSVSEWTDKIYNPTINFMAIPEFDSPFPYGRKEFSISNKNETKETEELKVENFYFDDADYADPTVSINKN